MMRWYKVHPLLRVDLLRVDRPNCPQEVSKADGLILVLSCSKCKVRCHSLVTTKKSASCEADSHFDHCVLITSSLPLRLLQPMRRQQLFISNISIVRPSATTRPSSITIVCSNNSFTSTLSFKSMNQKVPLMFQRHFLISRIHLLRQIECLHQEDRHLRPRD